MFNKEVLEACCVSLRKNLTKINGTATNGSHATELIPVLDVEHAESPRMIDKISHRIDAGIGYPV